MYTYNWSFTSRPDGIVRAFQSLNFVLISSMTKKPRNLEHADDAAALAAQPCVRGVENLGLLLHLRQKKRSWRLTPKVQNAGSRKSSKFKSYATSLPCLPALSKANNLRAFPNSTTFICVHLSHTPDWSVTIVPLPDAPAPDISERCNSYGLSSD